MWLPTKREIGLFVVVVLAMTFRASANDNRRSMNAIRKGPNWTIGSDQTLREPRYQGKALSYWLKVIRNRNEDLMPLAFEAIGTLGPDASSAVPELTRVRRRPL